MFASMHLLLHYRQQTRSYLVLGVGARDACVITLSKSPRLMHPCLLFVSTSHGGRNSGSVICSSSSAWRKPDASGEIQTIEQGWEEYYADPLQWWDNRFPKMNPELSDFKHKVTMKALWVDGWSTSPTPPWAKAMVKLVTLSKLSSGGGYHTNASLEILQPNRLLKGNFERRNTLAASAKVSKQVVQVSGGSTRMQSAPTASEAIDLLKNRLQQGIAVNSYSYVEILKRCLKPEDLTVVKQVHECTIESGMQKNMYVATNLLSGYIRCGRLEDACRVFDELAKKDVVTWNVMIGGYAQHRCVKDAMEVFHRMRKEGMQPNAVTYLSILKACASPSASKWVEEVHSYIRQGGLESDVRVGTSLLKMYSKCGNIEEARNTFNLLASRDVITWNVMIGAYSDSGDGEEAYRLLLEMKRDGFRPDAFTYASILNACASAGALEWVREVHSHAREAGFELNVRVGNALVHMYAKCGSIDDARLTFDKMEERDVITWNVMIGGLAQHGCGPEAYQLLLQMKRGGFKSEAITYMSILNECSSAGDLEWVRKVHSHAREAGFEFDVRVGTALVRMYAKCGSIDDARLAFDKMEERDVITWSVMIGGLAEHGCGHEALEVFKSMIADGVKPDEISFVAVLSACSHSGLVDESRRHFLAMTQDYGIEPSVVLCNCMVDVLARAGHLEEAKLLIDNMPVEPNGATWGALLGACRTYGNVELGKLAANELFKLEPKDASAYVLLSNIYAAAGKWEEVLWVRTMMQERGIRKEPGRSWIAVDNKVHYFVVGDTSHSEAKEIYAELRSLSETMKAEGYIPDTRLVLRNIEEEEKELALCSHSEKLAIVYGLMRMPLGQPIRVFKNLRVCSDCHIATKFISKATKRDVVVRDANRFHHFQDGVCSCGDYW